MCYKGNTGVLLRPRAFVDLVYTLQSTVAVRRSAHMLCYLDTHEYATFTSNVDYKSNGNVSPCRELGTRRGAETKSWGDINLNVSPPCQPEFLYLPFVIGLTVVFDLRRCLMKERGRGNEQRGKRSESQC